MNSTLKLKTERIKSFDSLRALAMMAVLLCHACGTLFRGGWIGVDLFFALSGYLITSLLLSEYAATNTISLKKFYIKRTMRLLPPMLVLLIGANILWPLSKLPVSSNQQLSTISAIFYSINLVKDNVVGNLSHIWSLSVEEQFYFIWPAVILVLLKFPRQKIIRSIIIMVIVLSVARIFIFNYRSALIWGNFSIDPYRFTFCRLDCTLLGALLSFLLSDKASNDAEVFFTPKRMLWMLPLAITMLTLVIVLLASDSPLWYNGGFLVTNALCIFVVYAAIKYQSNRVFGNRVLNWLGKRSYGIYLYHFPIFLYLEQYRVMHNWQSSLVITVLRFAISIGVAALSYKYLEQPILNLRSQTRSKRRALPMADMQKPLAA
jgi:peptidoglycan/LPS O-acetylase OafA/YrhL